MNYPHFFFYFTEILSTYPVFSETFLKKMLEKYTDEIVVTKINDYLCYQTIESLGIDSDFSLNLHAVLDEVRRLSLKPSQDIIHALLSVRLGYNISEEWGVQDDETFRHTISMYYSDERQRTWKAGCFVEADIDRCDKVYIAFSGGKDSVALLHLCNEVLPHDVPVIFSDTDMELPDTYEIWDEVQKNYPKRTFIRAKANTKALDNWSLFGPPSRTIRWCCSVHKSTPALNQLKKMLGKSSVRVMAFVGVRGEESISRSFYEDSSNGVKNASQMNRMLRLLRWIWML